MFDRLRERLPRLALAQVVRVLIAALVLLATMLLSVGERSPVMTLLTLAVLAISAYVTDVKGIFRFKQRMADFVALGVVAVSAINLTQIDRPGQLMAVANLQSYLQYVLLFQPKTPRIYWQLALLSLGQLAIASTLVPGPMYGVVLFASLVVCVLTFALLSLVSLGRRFTPAAATSEPARSEPASRPANLACCASPALEGHAAPRPPGFSGGLARQTALVSVASILVTAFVFALLPRWDVPNREIATREPLRTVGFSKTVMLGELGEVVQNPEVVMRVELFHNHETRPFKLAHEPLFRGTVVTEYDAGSWTQSFSAGTVPLTAETHTPFVRQRITAEPLDVPELSCVFPVFLPSSDLRLRVTHRRDELQRHEDFRHRELEFEIGTTGIVGDRQRDIITFQTPLTGYDKRSLTGMGSTDPSQPDPFPGLRAAAARVLAEQSIDPKQDTVMAARALNAYLSHSGQFFYSLDAKTRDEKLDPLEEFVTTRRQGHCEYFAGALVMMLRSQNIPARMAIGFKGGEWNALGGYYQVQQLHAHAWVEVYLEPNQIPKVAIVKDEPPAGAWLVLDPTDGVQEANTVTRRLGLAALWNQYSDYVQVLWSNYVVGMSPRRQQQGIYEPMAEAVGSTAELALSPRAWRGRLRTVLNSQVGVFWQWYRRHWFSWAGCLVVLAVGAVVVALLGGVRGTLWLLRRLGLVRRPTRASEPPVLEMYRRLESALGRLGLERRAAQTPYEFAVAAAGELAERLDHRRVAHLPRRVVEAFYRVRFGGHALDNQEALAVEHALVELELAPGRGRQHRAPGAS